MAGGKKINFTLIGAGGMGRRWARVLAAAPGVILKGVVDQNQEQANLLAKLHQVISNTDLDPVLTDVSIQAAVVALPHKFLAPVAIKLLGAGKHVLNEKPGARSVRELDRVIQAAKKSGRRFMVGFNHRFHPSHQKAKDLILKGAIGEILFLRTRYGFGGRKMYQQEWRHNKDMSGGGQLIDQGIHLIDLVRWFLGEIREVKGFTQQAFWRSDVEDNAFLLLRDRKGRVASLHASWSHWKPIYSMEIFGSKGYILIDGLGKKYGGYERVYVGRRSADFGVENERVIECDTDADNSLREELKEFIVSIHEDREPSPCAGDAREALKIVEAVYAQEKQ